MSDSKEEQTKEDKAAESRSEADKAAAKFQSEHAAIVPLQLLETSGGILIYKIRHQDGVYITGDVVNWEPGWRYEDYSHPHIEKYVNFTDEEANLIQEIVGEDVSEMPEEMPEEPDPEE